MASTSAPPAASPRRRRMLGAFVARPRLLAGVAAGLVVWAACLLIPHELSLVTAARLVLGGTGAASGAVGTVWEVLLLLLVGLAAGVLAGLLGVGGGIIMVPGLVILAGSDADTARGTSLLVVVATALTATATNLRSGLVDVRIGLTAGLVGVPAGLAGAALGQWIPERAALVLFAGLLVVSGARMLGRSRAGTAAAA